MAKVTLKNCWEILQCGRQANGNKVNQLGECIASREQLGHSCWAVAGTLCGGQVQGSVDDKRNDCMRCEVFKKYHRSVGADGKKIKEAYPEEEKKYNELLMSRMSDKYQH